MVDVNKLLENFESTHDLDLFLTAFEMAVENRLGRHQFLSKLKPPINVTPPSLDDFQKIVEWAEKLRFKKYQPARPLVTRASSPEADSLFESARSLGAEVRSANQKAEDHPYWFFRPAWQVQSALWNEIFGEHDPAITIARYARLSFKSDANQPNSKEISLTDEDILIIGHLIDYVIDGMPVPKELDSVHFRTIVALAIGAEHLFADKAFRQFPFETILRQATQPGGLPHWIVQKILQLWGRTIDATYGSDLSEIDAPSKERLTTQAHFFGAVLLKYALGDDSIGDDVPKLNYISDRSFTDALHIINWLRFEFDTPDLDHLYREVIGATDLARVRQFGGQLPFSIYEASDLYNDTNLETWMSQIAVYESEKYDDVSDRFSCIRYLAKIPRNVSGEKRENKFAIKRFGEYSRALDEMLRDGLDALASAWWSFFIASQTIIFGGLAVPPDKLQEILREAKCLSEEFLNHMNHL